MEQPYIFCAGETPAGRYARNFLISAGAYIMDDPDPKVTHLMLDVPSFGPEGQLRMGGDVRRLLSQFSGDVTVLGGNLDHSALRHYRVVDFLRDETYLAKNAYITAECALDVALPYLTVTICQCPVLIIGWGRIGKCLAQLLKAIGAEVTVAARKENDRAMLQALGYETVDTAALGSRVDKFRLIFNTVPYMILPASECGSIRKDCTVIDLASAVGIGYEDTVIARGLPGVHMPESSGKLIAQTVLRYLKEE